MSENHLLTINGGSSSVKFAVFLDAGSLQKVTSGNIERLGTGESANQTAQRVADEIQKRLGTDSIAAVGHRIVHGGIHLLDHQIITSEVLAELKKIELIDRPHLPREIALIEAFQKLFPDRPHVACFDTAFHRNLPRVAQLLPIPLEFAKAGIRRFGFHGLSYTYLMQRLAELAGAETARGRIILAHLGSGASMAAVRGGKPIDTTMAFTPLAGLVMGTRTGDIDPGFLIYLMRSRNMSPDQLEEFISSKCGLLGLSETSADMRDLLARRSGDARALDAIDLFCYQAKKYIGALATTLGGLDTLVFSGGIGEHAPEVRAGICSGLDFLGVYIDSSANTHGEDVISNGQSRVVVRVIPTDEEIIIAQTVRSLLRGSAK